MACTMLAQDHDFRNYIASIGTSKKKKKRTGSISESIDDCSGHKWSQAVSGKPVPAPRETSMNTSLIDLLNAITGMAPDSTLAWNMTSAEIS